MACHPRPRLLLHTGGGPWAVAQSPLRRGLGEHPAAHLRAPGHARRRPGGGGPGRAGLPRGQHLRRPHRSRHPGVALQRGPDRRPHLLHPVGRAALPPLGGGRPGRPPHQAAHPLVPAQTRGAHPARLLGRGGVLHAHRGLGPHHRPGDLGSAAHPHPHLPAPPVVGQQPGPAPPRPDLEPGGGGGLVRDAARHRHRPGLVRAARPERRRGRAGAAPALGPGRLRLGLGPLHDRDVRARPPSAAGPVAAPFPGLVRGRDGPRRRDRLGAAGALRARRGPVPHHRRLLEDVLDGGGAAVRHRLHARHRPARPGVPGRGVDVAAGRGRQRPVRRRVRRAGGAGPARPPGAGGGPRQPGDAVPGEDLLQPVPVADADHRRLVRGDGPGLPRRRG